MLYGIKETAAEALKNKGITSFKTEQLSGNEGKAINCVINGKASTRKVHYRSDCGLYITIKGVEVYEYDLEV